MVLRYKMAVLPCLFFIAVSAQTKHEKQALANLAAYFKVGDSVVTTLIKTLREQEKSANKQCDAKYTKAVKALQQAYNKDKKQLRAECTADNKKRKKLLQNIIKAIRKTKKTAHHGESTIDAQLARVIEYIAALKKHAQSAHIDSTVAMLTAEQAKLKRDLPALKEAVREVSVKE